MSESELEQEWIASGAHESFVSWLVSNLIQAREDIDTLASVDNQLWHDERNRGDIYRRRALALLQLIRIDHNTAVSIIQKQDFELAMLHGRVSELEGYIDAHNAKVMEHQYFGEDGERLSKGDDWSRP